jgi:hypothetical protein
VLAGYLANPKDECKNYPYYQKYQTQFDYELQNSLFLPPQILILIRGLLDFLLHNFSDRPFLMKAVLLSFPVQSMPSKKKSGSTPVLPVY